MAPTKRSPAGPPHSPHCYRCTNLSDFFTSDISPSHCFPMSLLCLQAVHPFSCTAPSPFGFSARMAFPSHNITLHLPPLLPLLSQFQPWSLLAPTSSLVFVALSIICWTSHSRPAMALPFFTFHFHLSVAFIISFQALSSNFLLSAPQIYPSLVLAEKLTLIWSYLSH